MEFIVFHSFVQSIIYGLGKGVNAQNCWKYFTPHLHLHGRYIMTSPLFQGVACQVSSAIVSAVSALTYQLGKQLAPIVVEQGSKVLMIYFTIFIAKPRHLENHRCKKGLSFQHALSALFGGMGGLVVRSQVRFYAISTQIHCRLSEWSGQCSKLV